MNILYLTIVKIRNLDTESIYTDLMSEFISHGHKVYIAGPIEKRENRKSVHKTGKNYEILGINIGNYYNTGNIEKGMTIVTMEDSYRRAIEHFWGDVKFDLILYSTPPITFNRIIRHFKKQGVPTYLMLKDIFPQNAVDIGLMSTTGLKNILYRYFRSQEKELYRLSDTIGCMSEANVEYVLSHNPEIDRAKVEICPNAVRIRERKAVDNKAVREKYGIPEDKVVFVYGGNLGLPQGPDFILQCLEANEKSKDTFILIVGSGTEYDRFHIWFADHNPRNSKLIEYLPHEEYMELLASCDVGLIFLDHRFTIPNFPSRLLSYMEMKMPVLAATDSNTDVGRVIEDGGFGYWCESNDVMRFTELMQQFVGVDRDMMGEEAYKYLEDKYSSDHVYDIISGHVGIKGTE